MQTIILVTRSLLVDWRNHFMRNARTLQQIVLRFPFGLSIFFLAQTPKLVLRWPEGNFHKNVNCKLWIKWALSGRIDDTFVSIAGGCCCWWWLLWSEWKQKFERYNWMCWLNEINMSDENRTRLMFPGDLWLRVFAHAAHTPRIDCGINLILFLFSFRIFLRRLYFSASFCTFAAAAQQVFGIIRKSH